MGDRGDKYDFGHMTPVPELIMPGKWKKQNAGDSRNGGSVDISKKQFNSPWDGSDESVAIRAHEYLHIKYSPPKDMVPTLAVRGKAYNMAVMSLEDERVNYLGAERHAMDLTPIAKIPFEFPPSGFPPYVAACVYLSQVQYKDQALSDKLLAMIPEKWSKRLPEVLDILYKGADDFETTTIAAQKLIDIFTDKDDPENKGDGKGEAELDQQCPSTTDQQSRTDQASKQKIEALNNLQPDMRPGKMDITKPSLHPARSCKVHVGRARRPDEYGMVFKYPERFVTDKACFSSMKKEGLGTILFDISGSMSLNDSEVMEVLKYANNATIATYSGRNSHGVLTVVATGGKVIKSAPEQLGGNIVDLPALKWLSKQRGPRFWICDGIVTGCNDSQDHAYTKACFEIAKKYHVLRFNNPQVFIEALKAKQSLQKASEFEVDVTEWWKNGDVKVPRKAGKRK